MSDEPPLHVTRWDRGRFRVRSQRPACPNAYIVDLGDPLFPLGRCECDDYNIRIESAINRGDEPIRWTCLHIDRVQAELHHARQLCCLAGVPFDVGIIPIAA